MTIAEEQILVAAVEKTATAYQASPTVGNLREWNASKNALEIFQRAQLEKDSGLRFKNLAEVARWLGREGYKITERTVRNHYKASLFAAQPGGEFRQIDIEAYARHHLERPGYPGGNGETPGGAKERFLSAQAEERELKVKMLRGELIDAAEEAARDARLWGAVRADITNRAPAVINELVERITGLGTPEDLRHRIVAIIPDLRVIYEDFLDEIFDRYAREGGVSVDV